MFACVCFLLQPGDYSHVESEEQFLQSIVTEEYGKESFTAVVITGIQQEHVTYLKQNFNLWTRELAYVSNAHTLTPPLDQLIVFLLLFLILVFA